MYKYLNQREYILMGNLRNRWGGRRFGEIILADEEFLDRICDSRFKQNTIQLLNGIYVTDALATPVARCLAVGTLAVAVANTGDGVNTYLPVTLSSIDGQQRVMVPCHDLQFDAYNYGRYVGQLSVEDTVCLRLGQPVPFTDAIMTSAQPMPLPPYQAES